MRYDEPRLVVVYCCETWERRGVVVVVYYCST
jgi:hypothetical protein